MSIDAAERARHARRRKALGVHLHHVELDPYQIQLLIDRGLIDADSLNDRYEFAQELGFAIEELLARNDVTVSR